MPSGELANGAIETTSNQGTRIRLSKSHISALYGWISSSWRIVRLHRGRVCAIRGDMEGSKLPSVWAEREVVCRHVDGMKLAPE